MPRRIRTLANFIRLRLCTRNHRRPLAEKAFEPVPNLRFSLTTNELVVLNTRDGAVYKANASGALIWEQILLGMSTVEIGAALHRSFGIPSAQAVEDARQFIRELAGAGILRVQGAR